jgi:hypothetical protein
MVKSNEDLESHFIKLDRRYHRREDGTFLVAVASEQPPIAVRFEEPVIVLQVRIGSAPPADNETSARVFRKLLELNTSDLVHFAYGLEAGEIVLSAALEAENLDLNELEAALSDASMALTTHVPLLRPLVEAAR